MNPKKRLLVYTSFSIVIFMVRHKGDAMDLARSINRSAAESAQNHTVFP